MIDIKKRQRIHTGTPVKPALPVRPVTVVTTAFAVFVVVLIFLALRQADLFNVLMYEDGWGEWATFHAFALAGGIGLVVCWCRIGAMSQAGDRADRRVATWILLLLSLFCLGVAGEEVSWGQRLTGALPPDLFQELNFQQELNIHNILSYVISARVVFGLICFGYGVALPISLQLLHKSRDGQSETTGLLSVLNAVAPHLSLSVWFALAGIVYWYQPVLMALEAAELLFGLLFLADVILKCGFGTSRVENSTQQSAWLFVAFSAPLVLGAITNPIVDRFVFGSDEQLVAQARDELDSIAWDLQHAGAIHPQIAQQNGLFDDRFFNTLREDLIRFSENSRFYGSRWDSDLSENESRRRAYFLDPWNNPYWICMKGRGLVHLYSFGPNRRLDTVLLSEQRVPSESDLKDDDIGIWVDVYGGAGSLNAGIDHHLTHTPKR